MPAKKNLKTEVKKVETVKDTEIVETPVVEQPSEKLGQPTAVIPMTNSMIVAPVVTPEQAKLAWQQFSDLKSALLTKSDYQVLTMRTMDRGMWKIVQKPFVKKAGWRKLATAFNLSVEVIKEERKEYAEMPYKDGKNIIMKPGFVHEVVARATAMNGRHMDGTGSCASNERGFAHLEHDVRGTAETRAKNRAISDLIGGGEVSAEEMENNEDVIKQQTAVQPEVTHTLEYHKSLPIRIVQKEGKNKGKPFRMCQCRMPDGRNWFEWVSVEEYENSLKANATESSSDASGKQEGDSF